MPLCTTSGTPDSTSTRHSALNWHCASTAAARSAAARALASAASGSLPRISRSAPGITLSARSTVNKPLSKSCSSAS